MSSLRKHGWRYELNLALAYTRYYCRGCGVTKYEHRDGKVTYSLPGPDFTYNERDVIEEPCCSPPFDPHVSLEDLAKAGFVPVALCSEPQPMELQHEPTVRRIAHALREQGYVSQSKVL